MKSSYNEVLQNKGGNQIKFIIVLWLLCSILAYGGSFAYYQRNYPTLAKQSYRQEMGICMIMSLIGGPISLLVTTFTSGFFEHGFKVK